MNKFYGGLNIIVHEGGTATSNIDERAIYGFLKFNEICFENHRNHGR